MIERMKQVQAELKALETAKIILSGGIIVKVEHRVSMKLLVESKKIIPHPHLRRRRPHHPLFHPSERPRPPVPSSCRVCHLPHHPSSSAP